MPISKDSSAHNYTSEGYQENAPYAAESPSLFWRLYNGLGFEFYAAKHSNMQNALSIRNNQK
jgi:hypothetical protein